MKECNKCLQKKPLTDFYKHPDMVDGHLNKCKVCAKKDTRLNYIKNIDKYKEYDRSRAMLPHRVTARTIYQATEAGKLSIRKSNQRWKKDNPLKQQAYWKLWNKILYGKITKKPCLVCGEIKVQGHHWNYKYPFWVFWLCSKHHSRLHKLKMSRKCDA